MGPGGRLPLEGGKRLLVAAVVVMTPVLLLSGTAYTANGGAYGTTFVDGDGTLTDDWGDHYEEIGNSLCDGCADSQNRDSVVLWQAILFSEGLLSASGVDGYFGAGTDDATEKWQTRFGLSSDGWVGDGTWGAADGRLAWSYDDNSFLRYRAKSGSGYVLFIRGNLADDHGGDAYELVSAHYGSSRILFDGASDDRIHFFKRNMQPR